MVTPLIKQDDIGVYCLSRGTGFSWQHGKFTYVMEGKVEKRLQMVVCGYG